MCGLVWFVQFGRWPRAGRGRRFVLCRGLGWAWSSQFGTGHCPVWVGRLRPPSALRCSLSAGPSGEGKGPGWDRGAEDAPWPSGDTAQPQVDTEGTLQGQGVGMEGTLQLSLPLSPPPCWDRAMGAGNGRIPCQTGGYLWTLVWGWLERALPPSQAPFHPCSFSLFIIPSLTFPYSFSPLAPPFSSPLSCPISPPSSFPCFLCLPGAIHISSLLSPGIPNQALSDFWVKRGEAETQPQAGVRAQECPWGWRGRPGPAHGSFAPRSVSHSAELWLTELPGNFRY